MAATKKPVRLTPPAETQGWKVLSAKALEVVPKTIFEYMDGAGELYLAYQFRRLLVWTYRGASDTSITVEAYDMGSPGEAFGILSQDLEGENVKVGQESVYAAGLLRFWQGRWFFRILADVETSPSREAVLALGRAFCDQVPAEGERPKIVARLPREGLLPHTVHYFHKQVSLNAIYFFAVENLLGLDERTEAVIADYRFDKERAGLLIVCYPDAGAAAKARTSFRDRYLSGLALSPEPFQLAQLENGEWVGLRLDGQHLIVAFRSRSRDVSERLLKAVNLTNGGKQK